MLVWLQLEGRCNLFSIWGGWRLWWALFIYQEEACLSIPCFKFFARDINWLLPLEPMWSLFRNNYQKVKFVVFILWLEGDCQVVVAYDTKKVQVYMGVGTHKGANGITLQKDYGYFLVLFIFSYEFFVKWNLLQLVIKNTYSCPNRSHVL